MTSATPAATPVLKRSRSDLEATTSPLAGPSTVKRPRVQFKSENTVHTLQGWDDEKTLSLVREEVRRALEKHMGGESTLYTGLCQLLAHRPSAADALSARVLKRYMVAITGLCRIMGRRGLALVQSITRISWLGRDEEFVKLYQTLLTNLISTYGGYSHDILFSLVSRFTTLRPRHGRLPHETRVPMQQMLERLHGCIRHILQKVPSAINQLQTELRQDFPHPSDTFHEHMDYVSNLLRVASYAAYIKSDLVAMIFDKVTILDAQMQTSIEDLEEELEADLGQNLAHQMNVIMSQRQADDEEADEGDVSDSDDESVIDEFENPDQRRLHEAKQEVAKLDGLMTVLFNHFQPYFDFSKASMDEQFAIFDQLFGMFARVVLTTDRSRYIQFLLFHYAQSSEELSERFVHALIGVLTDLNADKMIRRSASAYLASFISRGARVSRHLVEHTFYVLSKELDRLRVLHEANEVVIPDLNRFGPYYTIFQCLMYIFCFRWRDLLAEDIEDDDFDVHELSWSRDIADTFRRNLGCRLNPLKVCAPGIVNQFTVIVRQLEFMYLDGIVEQNKRIRLTRSMATANGGFSILAESNNAEVNQGEAHLQLGAYFPFDPYKLPLSKARIDSQYNPWRPVPGFDVSEASNSEPEEEMEGEIFDEPTETESAASH